MLVFVLAGEFAECYSGRIGLRGHPGKRCSGVQVVVVFVGVVL